MSWQRSGTTYFQWSFKRLSQMYTIIYIRELRNSGHIYFLRPGAIKNAKFFFYPVICNIIHHLKYIHSHNKICMRIENEQNIFLSLKLNMKVAVNRYLRGEMVLYFIGAFIGSWITIKAIKFISHLSFTSNCFNLHFFLENGHVVNENVLRH